MKSLNVLICFVFLSALMGSTSLLSAGVYYETEIQSNVDPGLNRTQTFISGSKIKTMYDDSHGWIIDLQKGILWDFDLSANTYYEISLNDMVKEFDRIGEQMQVYTELFDRNTDADKKLKQELKDEPGELNPFGDSQAPMGKVPETEFTPFLKQVKKKKNIQDYECYLVQVDISPTDKSELWVTDKIGYTEEVRNFWKAFFRTSSQPLNQFLPLKQNFEIMTRLDGFVMQRKTEIKRGGSESFEEVETVTLLESRKISDAEFVLPKGMKKVEPGFWDGDFDKEFLEEMKQDNNPRARPFDIRGNAEQGSQQGPKQS